MSMGSWCNVVSTSPLRRVSGYLRCSTRLAEKELILPSTQPYLSLPARLVKGTSLSGRRTTLVDHRRARRVVQGAGSTPADPCFPLTVNRRQFLTAILIAPMIRVYRARHRILSLSEMVAITLKRYAPGLRRNLQQSDQLYHRAKERLINA